MLLSIQFYENINTTNINIKYLSILQMETKDELIKNIKNYLEIDNNIKAHQQQLKQLRKDKKDTMIARRNEVLEGTGRMESYGPNRVLAYFGELIEKFLFRSN